MEAIIGEGPGGNLAAFLMIEERGVEYPRGDYPVFQLKDDPLPTEIHPGAGVEIGSVPAGFSGKKMIFQGI